MKDELTRMAEWESALQSELERLQHERDRVDIELQRAAKKLELVKQMRLLESSPTDATPRIAPTIKEARATPTTVREMAHRILSESSRPLHISEIHQQFVARGYAIPGSGTPFNILAHLVNNKSFVRVARGTYALVGSVPEEQILPRAERKSKRRRRKKSARKVRTEGV
jgi:hypothetical protein